MANCQLLAHLADNFCHFIFFRYKGHCFSNAEFYPEKMEINTILRLWISGRMPYAPTG